MKLQDELKRSQAENLYGFMDIELRGAAQEALKRVNATMLLSTMLLSTYYASQRFRGNSWPLC